MPLTQHVDHLLELKGPAFLSGVYQTLLGRAPDEEGKRHYLGRLHAGYGKRYIIAEISRSAEAKSFKAELQGMEQLVAEEKKANHWLWGGYFRSSRIERKFNQIEYQLECVEYQLSALGRDGGVAGTVDSSSLLRLEAGVDTASLTLRAWQILARFSQSDARSMDARGL